MDPDFPVSLTACVHSRAATDNQAGRYPLPENVVIAPESGVGPRLSSGRIATPMYPADARSRRLQARPVVAYIVDTVGLIESGTVTFLSDEPRVFRRSICEWASVARFDPLIRDRRPRRALVVTSFSFFVTENPLALPAQSPSDRVFADRFRGMSSHDVFALLEKSAHC